MPGGGAGSVNSASCSRAAALTGLKSRHLSRGKVRDRLFVENVMDMVENARRRVADRDRYDHGVVSLDRFVEAYHRCRLQERDCLYDEPEPGEGSGGGDIGTAKRLCNQAQCCPGMWARRRRRGMGGAVVRVDDHVRGDRSTPRTCGRNRVRYPVGRPYLQQNHPIGLPMFMPIAVAAMTAGSDQKGRSTE